MDTVPEYKNIIQETNEILSSVLTDNDLSEGMLESLEKDIFLFSALKTHAQLFEASRLLLTEDKKIKSFTAFSNDVKSIKSNYNENYLEAEYEFAVGSVQMAERWEGFSDSKRYNLQYRTAGDSHVRETHAVLNGITLPQSDPFWDSYYAPNGWRCRCTVVEVLESDGEVSDSEKSVSLGEKATSQIDKDGNNKLAIFRFNPAQEKVVFPPKHPYNKVAGADIVKTIVANNNSDKDYEILNKNERFKTEKERAKSRGILKKYKELNENEATAIHMYSLADGYYGYVNGYSRTGKMRLAAKADGFNEGSVKSMAKVMNEGLDKIPDRYKGKTYRGTSLKPEQLQQYKDALSDNKVHTEKGFMSTTILKNRAFNGNTNFVVEAKNGAKIEKLADLPDEQEVLFKDNQQFKVTKIEEKEGKHTIYMEEI